MKNSSKDISQQNVWPINILTEIQAHIGLVEKMGTCINQVKYDQTRIEMYGLGKLKAHYDDQKEKQPFSIKGIKQLKGHERESEINRNKT